MPDDHSKLVPLLPIPNRTVKRLCADDSADARVKVGHRQALTTPLNPHLTPREWGFWLCISVRVPNASSQNLPSGGQRLKSWCILQGFADH